MTQCESDLKRGENARFFGKRTLPREQCVEGEICRGSIVLREQCVERAMCPRINVLRELCVEEVMC